MEDEVDMPDHLSAKAQENAVMQAAENPGPKKNKEHRIVRCSW